ncbi:MAG: hypothetical protein V4489_02340, partial [Chlamydiota bacterium]
MSADFSKRLQDGMNLLRQQMETAEPILSSQNLAINQTITQIAKTCLESAQDRGAFDANKILALHNLYQKAKHMITEPTINFTSLSGIPLTKNVHDVIYSQNNIHLILDELLKEESSDSESLKNAIREAFFFKPADPMLLCKAFHLLIENPQVDVKLPMDKTALTDIFLSYLKTCVHRYDGSTVHTFNQKELLENISMLISSLNGLLEKKELEPHLTWVLDKLLSSSNLVSSIEDLNQVHILANEYSVCLNPEKEFNAIFQTILKATGDFSKITAFLKNPPLTLDKEKLLSALLDSPFKNNSSHNVVAICLLLAQIKTARFDRQTLDLLHNHPPFPSVNILSPFFLDLPESQKERLIPLLFKLPSPMPSLGLKLASTITDKDTKKSFYNSFIQKALFSSYDFDTRLEDLERNTETRDLLEVISELRFLQSLTPILLSSLLEIKDPSHQRNLRLMIVSLQSEGVPLPTTQNGTELLLKISNDLRENDTKPPFTKEAIQDHLNSTLIQLTMGPKALQELNPETFNQGKLPEDLQKAYDLSLFLKDPDDPFCQSLLESTSSSLNEISLVAYNLLDAQSLKDPDNPYILYAEDKNTPDADKTLSLFDHVILTRTSEKYSVQERYHNLSRLQPYIPDAVMLTSLKLLPDSLKDELSKELLKKCRPTNSLYGVALELSKSISKEYTESKKYDSKITEILKDVELKKIEHALVSLRTIINCGQKEKLIKSLGPIAVDIVSGIVLYCFPSDPIFGLAWDLTLELKDLSIQEKLSKSISNTTILSLSKELETSLKEEILNQIPYRKRSKFLERAEELSCFKDLPPHLINSILTTEDLHQHILLEKISLLDSSEIPLPTLADECKLFIELLDEMLFSKEDSFNIPITKKTVQDYLQDKLFTLATSPQIMEDLSSDILSFPEVLDLDQNAKDFGKLEKITRLLRHSETSFCQVILTPDSRKICALLSTIGLADPFNPLVVYSKLKKEQKVFPNYTPKDTPLSLFDYTVLELVSKDLPIQTRISNLKRLQTYLSPKGMLPSLSLLPDTQKGELIKELLSDFTVTDPFYKLIPDLEACIKDKDQLEVLHNDLISGTIRLFSYYQTTPYDFTLKRHAYTLLERVMTYITKEEFTEKFLNLLQEPLKELIVKGISSDFSLSTLTISLAWDLTASLENTPFHKPAYEHLFTLTTNSLLHEANPLEKEAILNQIPDTERSKIQEKIEELTPFKDIPFNLMNVILMSNQAHHRILCEKAHRLGIDEIPLPTRPKECELFLKLLEQILFSNEDPENVFVTRKMLQMQLENTLIELVINPKTLEELTLDILDANHIPECLVKVDDTTHLLYNSEDPFCQCMQTPVLGNIYRLLTPDEIWDPVNPLRVYANIKEMQKKNPNYTPIPEETPANLSFSLFDYVVLELSSENLSVKTRALNLKKLQHYLLPANMRYPLTFLPDSLKGELITELFLTSDSTDPFYKLAQDLKETITDIDQLEVLYNNLISNTAEAFSSFEKNRNDPNLKNRAYTLLELLAHSTSKKEPIIKFLNTLQDSFKSSVVEDIVKNFSLSNPIIALAWDLMDSLKNTPFQKGAYLWIFTYTVHMLLKEQNPLKTESIIKQIPDAERFNVEEKVKELSPFKDFPSLLLSYILSTGNLSHHRILCEKISLLLAMQIPLPTTAAGCLVLVNTLDNMLLSKEIPEDIAITKEIFQKHLASYLTHLSMSPQVLQELTLEGIWKGILPQDLHKVNSLVTSLLSPETDGFLNEIKNPTILDIAQKLSNSLLYLTDPNNPYNMYATLKENDDIDFDLLKDPNFSLSNFILVKGLESRKDLQDKVAFVKNAIPYNTFDQIRTSLIQLPLEDRIPLFQEIFSEDPLEYFWSLPWILTGATILPDLESPAIEELLINYTTKFIILNRHLKKYLFNTIDNQTVKNKLEDYLNKIDRFFLPKEISLSLLKVKDLELQKNLFFQISKLQLTQLSLPNTQEGSDLLINTLSEIIHLQPSILITKKMIGDHLTGKLIESAEGSKTKEELIKLQNNPDWMTYLPDNLIEAFRISSFLASSNDPFYQSIQTPILKEISMKLSWALHPEFLLNSPFNPYRIYMDPQLQPVENPDLSLFDCVILKCVSPEYEVSDLANMLDFIPSPQMLKALSPLPDLDKSSLAKKILLNYRGNTPFYALAQNLLQSVFYPFIKEGTLKALLESPEFSEILSSLKEKDLPKQLTIFEKILLLESPSFPLPKTKVGRDFLIKTIDEMLPNKDIPITKLAIQDHINAKLIELSTGSELLKELSRKDDRADNLLEAHDISKLFIEESSSDIFFSSLASPEILATASRILFTLDPANFEKKNNPYTIYLSLKEPSLSPFLHQIPRAKNYSLFDYALLQCLSQENALPDFLELSEFIPEHQILKTINLLPEAGKESLITMFLTSDPSFPLLDSLAWNLISKITNHSILESLGTLVTRLTENRLNFSQDVSGEKRTFILMENSMNQLGLAKEKLIPILTKLPKESKEKVIATILSNFPPTSPLYSLAWELAHDLDDTKAIKTLSTLTVKAILETEHPSTIKNISSKIPLSEKTVIDNQIKDLVPFHFLPSHLFSSILSLEDPSCQINICKQVSVLWSQFGFLPKNKDTGKLLIDTLNEMLQNKIDLEKTSIHSYLNTKLLKLSQGSKPLDQLTLEDVINYNLPKDLQEAFSMSTLLHFKDNDFFNILPLSKTIETIYSQLDPNSLRSAYNPYNFYAVIKNEKKELVDYNLITTSEVEGNTKLSLNIQGFQINRTLAQKHVTLFKDLPLLDKKPLDLITALENKILSTTHEQKQFIQKALKDLLNTKEDQININLKQLRSPFNEGTYTYNLMYANYSKKDEVSPETVLLFDIFYFINNQRSNNPSPETGFTTQDDYLLLALAHLQNCSSAQLEGIATMHSFITEENLLLPNEAKGRNYIRKFIQDTLKTGITAMVPVIPLEDEMHIPQVVHQTLYLKNRLFDCIGLEYHLTFDEYPVCIERSLIVKNKITLLQEFYSKFPTPKKLIELLFDKITV